MALAAGSISPVRLVPPTPVTNRDLASLLNIRAEIQRVKEARYEDLPKRGVASGTSDNLFRNIGQALSALQDYSNVTDDRLRRLAVNVNSLGTTRDPAGNITWQAATFTFIAGTQVFSLSNGYAFFTVPNTAPDDGAVNSSSVTMWVDEVANELKFRIRYSDGTLKTGTVALV